MANMDTNSSNLVQRRHGSPANVNQVATELISSLEDDPIQKKLTLMEELLLLGMDNQIGWTATWNNTLSIALRGAILAELDLRRLVQLAPVGMRCKPLLSRKVIVENIVNTGDALLDEALNAIKSSKSLENVSDWILYLSGESWNPTKFDYQMKNVRERVAKALVDKGILTTAKKDFFLFDVTTHPLVDFTVKEQIVKRLHDALLDKWENDVYRMNKRTLALILLAHVGDVLQATLLSLSTEAYEVAKDRLDQILKMDFAREYQPRDNEVMWAVFATLVD